MVIMLKRVNMQSYDTVIERGIAVIEDIVRWNVNAAISPQGSAKKVKFGDDRLVAEYVETDNGDDIVFLDGPVDDRN